MPIRIFHPNHGYVLTSDQDVIDEILKKGGIIGGVKSYPDQLPETQERTVVKPLPPKRKTYGSR